MHILSFRPEMVLYIYMATSLAVLLFHIIYIFFDRFQGKQLERRSLEMVEEIQYQMQRLQDGKNIELNHRVQLERSMRRLEKMRAFECSVDEVAKQMPAEIVRQYMDALRPVFLHLTERYEKRDDIEQAYFASLIEKFGIDQGHAAYDGLMDFLIQLTIKKDIYVRENALKALYSIGNKEAVLFAWQKMREGQISHHIKLLSDGLLKFTGNRSELAQLLWDHRAEFDAHLTLSVMQFIRFSTDSFQDVFLKLMQTETEEKELRMEAVRYLRKYPYEPAREKLEYFIWYREYIDWEYAAIAATALAAYPGPDTVYSLKNGLNATNWYVRLNCAEALLEGLNASQKELLDVYDGKDRYAQEVLSYVTQKSKIQGQTMELNKAHV